MTVCAARFGFRAPRPRRRGRRRCRPDRPGRGPGGFTATEFALGAGVLLLPVTLLAASLPVWVGHQQAARVAARQAARQVAAAADVTSGWEDGRATVAAVAANRGATVEEATVDGTLRRGGAVTVRVTVRMPALVVPLAGAVAGFSWTAAHTEPVDPYHSVP